LSFFSLLLLWYNNIFLLKKSNLRLPVKTEDRVPLYKPFQGRLNSAVKRTLPSFSSQFLPIGGLERVYLFG
jgi:hypothetical protein